MDLPEHNRFIIGGIVADSRVAIAIFESLRFKTGESTRSSRLTIDQFRPTYPRTGKSLFQGNCSYCHFRNRTLDGPALTPELVNHYRQVLRLKTGAGAGGTANRVCE
jgi:hypothetical protein